MVSSMLLLPAVGLRRKGGDPSNGVSHVPQGRAAEKADLGRKNMGLPGGFAVVNGLSKAVSLLGKVI